MPIPRHVFYFPKPFSDKSETFHTVRVVVEEACFQSKEYPMCECGRFYVPIPPVENQCLICQKNDTLQHMQILHTKVLLEKQSDEGDYITPEGTVKKGIVVQCGEGSHKDGVFLKPDIKAGTVVWYKYGEDFDGKVLVDYSNIIAHE